MGHGAPHHMVAAAFGGRHHVVIHYVVRQYFGLWPPLYFGLWPLLYFGLWPLLYFGLLAPIVLRASWGQQKLLLWASLCHTWSKNDLKLTTLLRSGYEIATQLLRSCNDNAESCR